MTRKESRVWIGNEAKEKLVKLKWRYYWSQKHILSSLILLAIEDDILDSFDFTSLNRDSVSSRIESRVWIGSEAKDYLIQLKNRYYRTQKDIVSALIKMCVEEDLLEGFNLILSKYILMDLRDRGFIDQNKFLAEMAKPLEERSLDRH